MAPKMRYRGDFKDSRGQYTQVFFDSTGAFLIGELERLDPKVHQPLMEFTYHRDLPFRSDVTVADEYTSYMEIAYGAIGGPNANGKNWFSKQGNTIAAAQVDLTKTTLPFPLWAMGIDYDLPELESAQLLNRPLDQMKINAMQAKHQMDCDEQAYVGDTEIQQTGLVNNPRVVVNSAATGAGGSTLWAAKTPAEVLLDINTLLSNVWIQSALAVPPSKILLPPEAFKTLVNPVTDAGDRSIMTYVMENNIYKMQTGRDLDIKAVKWLADISEAGHGRMVAYTPKEDYVRFPLTPLQRTNIQYDLLKVKFAYWGRLGVVEFVKPETLGYVDEITEPIPFVPIPRG